MSSELKPIAWLMDDLVCPHRDFTSSSVVAERRAKKPTAWSVKPLVLAEDAQSHIEALEAENARLREALEPFADIADLIECETEGLSDSDELQLTLHDYLFQKFSVTKFKRARATLAKESSHG